MKMPFLAGLAATLLPLLFCVPRLGAAPTPIKANDASGQVTYGASSRGMLSTASAAVEEIVYSEDFENGAGGWGNADLTHGIQWHVTTYDAGDGNGPRGIWWMGRFESCWAGGGGYGNEWNQGLTKTFALGSGPITLTLAHQYDTEDGYDHCKVLVSNDGGTNFYWQTAFTGNSGGFTTDTVDLSWAAGQTVQIRLAFSSDYNTSDEDQWIDTDGGWRVDQVQVTGFPADDFDGGGDGWVAEELPDYVAEAPISYRLELDPPCNPATQTCVDTDHAWVAYDPSLGRVPEVTDYVGSWQPILGAIESPELPVPVGVDQVFLDFDVFHDNAWNNPPGFGDDTFYDWKIISVFPDGCERPGTDVYVYYQSPGWRHARYEITSYIDPGASAFRIEFFFMDFTQVLPEFGVIDSNHALLGPWFDNVQVSTVTNVEDVTVTGTVSGCSGPLLGVTVDLDHPDGSMLTTSTDASGNYAFSGVSASLDSAVVAIVVPLGYEAASPSPAQALVPLSADQVVDFSLSCLDPQGEARSMGYWKHQADVYLNDKGSAQESQADMETNYPDAIFNHFYENGLNAIRVSGVTFMDDGAGGDAALDLETIHTTLSVKGKAGMEAKAKQQYLAFLLNIASGKLLTSSVISDDGGTASQALQQVADAINDGDPDNDEVAKDICDTVNNAKLVGAGVIDLGIQTIAYARPSALTPVTTTLIGAAPNPFLASTTIRFSLKEPGEARVAVYDITGRLVRSVFDQWTEAGSHEVTWDGTDGHGSRVASGIYYVRMAAPDYMAAKRAVFVK